MCFPKIVHPDVCKQFWGRCEFEFISEKILVLSSKVPALLVSSSDQQFQELGNYLENRSLMKGKSVSM